MKKIASLVAASALLAACGSELDPNAVRSALPKKEAVQLGTPSQDPAAGALTLESQAQALGDSPLYQSEYAVQSYWTAVTVNVGVWWTLELLQVITAFPPSSCDETSCTWGPWVGDDRLNSWKLHAEKQGDGFAYQLSALDLVDPGEWVTLISGSGVAGVDRDHGSGTFTIDFDASDLLAHEEGWQKEDFGQLTVTYDNTSTISIGATLVNGRNDDPANPAAMNAVYAFTRDPGNGGELQVAFENIDTSEAVWLRTRWTPTGAGRADAHYVATGAEAFASECWAGAVFNWVEVYDTKPEPDYGAEAACPASMRSALYGDLALP